MRLPPIGEDRLNLLLRRAAEHDRNAALIATLSQETGQPLQRPTTADFAPDPMGLRGIPAVGRGVTGAIRHSRPTDCIR